MAVAIEEGRKPVQARSIQRVCLMLDTARETIIESGVESLTMNQLAHNTKLPVGSVYQYFPSKRALLKTLLEHHLKVINDRVTKILNEINDKPSLLKGLRLALTAIFELAYKDKLGYEIWVGTQFDPTLRKMQDDDGQNYTKILANKIAQVKGQDVTTKLLTQCTIYIVSLDACLRSVIDADEKTQQAVMDEFGNLLQRELEISD